MSSENLNHWKSTSKISLKFQTTFHRVTVQTALTVAAELNSSGIEEGGGKSFGPMRLHSRYMLTIFRGILIFDE